MADWTGRTVVNRADVASALAELTRHDRAGTSALAHAVQTAADAELAPDRARLLPVLPELRNVLPWPGGLLRGATIATTGSTSLLLALLAGATSEGAYVAVVGLPWCGALAALHDYRIPGERLALVPDPGEHWPIVVAALIDGVDMVVVSAKADERTGRSLQARAREKGCVLVPTQPWAGSDLTIERTASWWTGLSVGRGRLRRQHATFEIRGRGRASKPKTLQMMFPPASIAGPEPQPLYVPPADPTPRGSIPQNRLPARAVEDNPLWANMVPQDPPAAFHGPSW